MAVLVLNTDNTALHTVSLQHAIGMLLRKASAQGVAVSFVIVASTVTAVFLLGWRGAAALIRRRG